MRWGPEDLIQRACVSLCRCYPGVKAVAIPNHLFMGALPDKPQGGRQTTANIIALQKRKAYMQKQEEMGFWKGAPDLLILIGASPRRVRRAYLDEIKSKNGALSIDQENAHILLMGMGFPVYESYAVDEFAEHLKKEIGLAESQFEQMQEMGVTEWQ